MGQVNRDMGLHLTAESLTGSMFDFSRPKGAHLLKRTSDFENWRMARVNAGVWPFSRVLHSAPAPEMTIADEMGEAHPGLSLACQDYLGLTSHQKIREAAKKALKDFGPHSAGSPALAGNTSLSLQLEADLGEALNYEHIVLFPTGWAAGYGTITGLVRPDDYIIMDQLAHASLQQGAYAATRNVHRHSHLSIDAARKKLREIRADDSENGILVISEGLFSMDSDIPDIHKLQEVCQEYDAILMLDVAHDFGSMGPQGGGSLEIQNLLGKVDLVMGSFSKTFSSNGGFLATHHESVRQYIKFYGSHQTFSNALSPIQTAVISQALNIVRSDEGAQLREMLLDNVRTLRRELESKGISCIGSPSAIVPALIGDEAVARIAWAKSIQQGLHANLVEFPAVAVGSARFRMQVMPGHKKDRFVWTANVLAESIAAAKDEVKKINLSKKTRIRPSSSNSFGIKMDSLRELKKGDLAKLIKEARIEKFEAGQKLIEVGDEHQVLYIVQKGELSIEMEYHGQAIPIASCSAGDIIGEISMLDKKSASASVVAATDVELAAIDHGTIARLSKTDSELGMRLYKSLAIVLAERLRRNNNMAYGMGFDG